MLLVATLIHKLLATGIPSEKGHNDTGDALQARLKAELASITQDQPDPKTKTMKQTQRDQQISQAFKRREQKLKEQSVLAAKLNKVLTKRVAAGESHVREVQRIVTVSRRPGYIDYGEEKKEDLRIVKEITDQIRACEREIESLNKELANTRMTEKNKQKKTIKSMNKYVNRARNVSERAHCPEQASLLTVPAPLPHVFAGTYRQVANFQGVQRRGRLNPVLCSGKCKSAQIAVEMIFSNSP